MKLTAGTALQNGKYLINHVLDQSDLSLTLQATQTGSKRSVILKTLPEELQANPQYLAIKGRFQEQISCFAGCQHPGLVRLLGSFEEDGLLFAVMDQTAGQTLAEVVGMDGVLPEAVAISYMQQVGSALAVLHQHGIIHGNITPKSIVRPVGSEIVVLVGVELANVSTLGVPVSLLPIGDYRAIEQYQPQSAATIATDIYALAGTLYFLLTQHAPIAAPRRSQTELSPPRQFRPQLSSSLEAAILRGLELNPKTRPATIADWLSLLTRSEATLAVSAQATLPLAAPPLPAAQLQTNGSSNAPTSHQHSASRTRAVIEKPQSPHSSKQDFMATLSSKRFPKALITVAAVAAAIGVGTGLALRLAATSTGPGASFFHSEQSFPAFENWPTQVEPASAPPESSNLPSATPRQEAAPIPANPVQPAPKPQREAIAPAAAPAEVVPAAPSPQIEESPAPVPSTNPIVPESIAPPPPAAPAPAIEPEPPAPPPTASPPNP